MHGTTAPDLQLHITPSEREALQMLADNKEAHDIARCLGIGLPDLEAHLAMLFTAWGTSSRAAEAVAAAARRGLLREGAKSPT